MTKDELNKYIQTMVLKEVRETVPLIVRDVMSKMLMEAAVSKATPIGNSHKRRAIQEASISYGMDELNEYPTMDHSALTSRLGGQMRAPENLIVSEAITEQGTAIPVNPDELPDHVVRALTRNYSDVMKALEKKRG